MIPKRVALDWMLSYSTYRSLKRLRRRHPYYGFCMVPSNCVLRSLQQAATYSFDIQCHPRADAVCAELDSFFIQHWPFKSQEERNRFLNSQTNRFACWALPLADDDRLLDTVKVNTLLFLLDDVAEDMRALLFAKAPRYCTTQHSSPKSSI